MAPSPDAVERGEAGRPVVADTRPTEGRAPEARAPDSRATDAATEGKSAVLSALLRSEPGRSLTPRDQLALTRTTQTTLETVPIGTQSTWRNPESGANGSVTPTRTYQKANGQYCREFAQRIEIRGRAQEANGTACREPDGSWTLVDG
ncbi:MAG: hypothetical protein EXQ85_00425 [Alphaproteobacteria bacterium]|nr:hypothetical protein [Alphaproteobacteria bacterium]